MAIETPCFQVLKVCRIRAVRLDANGAFLTSTDNAVVSDAMTVLTYSPATLTGESLLERNGCGDIAVDYEDDDRPRGRGTVTLTLTELDAELLQALAGGTLLGTPTVGYEPPGAGDAVPNGVALEVWGWAYDTDEIARNDAGVRVYRRMALPLTRFIIGDDTNENGVKLYTLNGKAQTNSNFGSGPEGDWPADVSVPGAWFWDETGTLPTATCGYTDVTIAS